MVESRYQRKLIKRLKQTFPDCLVLKNDPNYIQGIPDLIVLIGNFWCMLEVKVSGDATHQPNQEWYVDKANDMSYSSFVYPENEDQVFNEIQRSLRASR